MFLVLNYFNNNKIFFIINIIFNFYFEQFL